jgi:hypothetical protein
LILHFTIRQAAPSCAACFLPRIRQGHQTRFSGIKPE